MKKTTLFLFGALCLLCASCEKENGDARDAVVGRYSYTRVGSYTVTIDGKTFTKAIDAEGTFTIEKDKSSVTTVGLVFDNAHYIKTGWIANENTLCFSDYKESVKSYKIELIQEDGTIFTTVGDIDYTVAYSPCKITDKAFSTVATISGTMSYNGEDFPLKGQVALKAKGF